MMFVRHHSPPLNCENQNKVIQQKSKENFLVRTMFLSPVSPSFLSGTVIPQLRATVPQKSHPSIAEQSSGICELILSCPRFCHNAAFFLSSAMPQRFLPLVILGSFFSLSLRPVFLSVTPASEPEPRSTLIPQPPGFRVKPGMTVKKQARNDKRKQKKNLQTL